MIMKRLSWPAMLRLPDFRNSAEFAGFYFDARELEDLNCLYSDRFFPRDDAGRMRLQYVATCFATLHLLEVLASTVAEAPADAPHRTELEETAQFVAERVLGSVLAALRCETLEAVISSVVELKFQIMTAIADARQIERRIEVARSIPKPEQAFRLFAKALKRRSSLRASLLIDQYEMLPRAFQPILNALLKRENLADFSTVVASRPFAFDTALEGTDSLQTGEDFDLLLAEYLPSERPEYITLLRQIVDRIRPGWNRLLEQLEGGLDYFADLSSRSVRVFLSLCQDAGLLSDYKLLVTRGDQRATAKRISEMFRDQLKTTAGVPEGQIWRLIRELSRSDEDTTVHYVLRLRSVIQTVENLSRPAVALVKKAFEEGALQFERRADASVLSLPESFTLAPLVLPALNADRVSGEVRTVPIETVERLSKELAWMGQALPADQKPFTKVLPSVSFEEAPDATVVRDVLRTAFGEKGIRLADGKTIGRGMISQLSQQIREADFTVLVLSRLRPNLLVEMGLTLGHQKHVIPLVQDGIRVPELLHYPFLLEMGRIGYSLTNERMAEAVNEILIRAPHRSDRCSAVAYKHRWHE